MFTPIIRAQSRRFTPLVLPRPGINPVLSAYFAPATLLLPGYPLRAYTNKNGGGDFGGGYMSYRSDQENDGSRGGSGGQGYRGNGGGYNNNGGN